MISMLKAQAPKPLRRLAGRLRRFLVQQVEARRSPREVFTSIYLQDKWDDGQKALTQGKFYSGPGSAEAFGRPYAAAVGAFMAEHGLASLVDVGCGDFRVGSLVAAHTSSYTGIDVVEPLIAENTRLHADERIRFLCLDMVTGDPPDADICLVRQVFQHLSNRQIIAILDKLQKYKWVLITEDQPGPPGSFVPNVDKAHGTGSRIVRQSGLAFDAPPFDLTGISVLLDLEAPEVTRSMFAAQACIITFAVPGAAIAASQARRAGAPTRSAQRPVGA